MDGTKIEWTDATWNPIRGCSRVSEGCRNCYAERVAARFSGPGMPYERLAQMTKEGPRWTGTIRLVTEKLFDPIRWKRPRRIFVNSISDLFHENVPDSWIDMIFRRMHAARWHTFQVLTKRPERMKRYCEMRFVQHHENPIWRPLPNVWLGVSVENQATADKRIPILLETPAAVRWISAEPLLGPLEIVRYFEVLKGGPYFSGLDWVVVGGESGPGARPMHPNWARSLRDQCVAAGIPFFFKQWGDWAPAVFGEGPDPGDGRGLAFKYLDDLYPDEEPSKVWRFGKTRAGRLLDGRTWDEFPLQAVPA